MVARSVGKLFILSDCNALETDCVYETIRRDTFRHQLPEFVHANGMVQHATQVTQRRFGRASSFLDLAGAPSHIVSLELDEPISRSDHLVIRMRLALQGLIGRSLFRDGQKCTARPVSLDSVGIKMRRKLSITSVQIN